MLHISGLTPFTTIDYPGCLSAVLFCQGCSWRCGYCHNRHLQPFGAGLLSWEKVLHFLKARIGFIDAVVFSGGEPTQQKNLQRAIAQVKAMGYKIGLHTAGVYPEGLALVLPLLDWVGMDIKAPFAHYERITRVEGSGEKAKHSAQILLDSSVAYEFRTTIQPGLLSAEDIEQMVEELVTLGARHYVIQPFRHEGKRDEAVLSDPIFSSNFLEQFQSRFASFFVR